MRRCLYLLVIFILAGCGQREKKLTCIFPGYDSMIYYHGSSDHMQDIRRGVVTNVAFTEGLLRTVKDHGYQVTFKPGDGGDVGGNVQQMAYLAKDHGINIQIAVIDSNEQKAFETGTPAIVEEILNGKKTEPFKLNLPKDEGDHGDSLLNTYPKSSRLIILVEGDNDLYAYWGDELKKGKKYSMTQMTDILMTHPKKGQIFVALRPGAECTYKGTVHALDMMNIAGIKHYGLLDIKEEEQDHLREVYR